VDKLFLQLLDLRAGHFASVRASSGRRGRERRLLPVGPDEIGRSGNGKGLRRCSGAIEEFVLESVVVLILLIELVHVFHGKM